MLAKTIADTALPRIIEDAYQSQAESARQLTEAMQSVNVAVDKLVDNRIKSSCLLYTPLRVYG